MSIAITYSAQLIGLKSEIVIIEVDISNGLHSFSVVGLGDRAVEESKDRISAAIKNSGFVSPKQKNQKVVISLAPADIRKEGPSFDLAMALAYLKASGEVGFDPNEKLFLGELSLEGNIRKINGLLPILCQASAHGFTSAFIPKDNEREASLARNIKIYAVSSIKEIVDHLINRNSLDPISIRNSVGYPARRSREMTNDMSIIRGNETAKRGLEIAAAGAHNILMCGPPGTGKTMLAKSFCSILPELTYEQSVEVTGIHSAAHALREDLIINPPFRSPHHTASYPSIVGGGSFPKPGEITLAHRGVLFLDEFPEFDRSVIEALRQPLEDRTITISRARGVITFPAQCILIASMNPCPCGLGKEMGCVCSEKTLNHYKRKISGPIMDRMDVWVSVTKIDYDKLSAKNTSDESSSAISARIITARLRQTKRFQEKGIPIFYNSEMDAQNLDLCVKIADDARTILKISAEKFGLSGRAFHRVIKVAQTIADLAREEIIKKDFILEALQYRQKIF
ncbi:MAG: YifB family Mg chelatase-like AAA ATPase [Patescibacteria group bacterium]